MCITTFFAKLVSRTDRFAESAFNAGTACAHNVLLPSYDNRPYGTKQQKVEICRAMPQAAPLEPPLFQLTTAYRQPPTKLLLF